MTGVTQVTFMNQRSFGPPAGFIGTLSYATSTDNSNGEGIVVDSSGNMFISGQFFVSSTSTTSFGVVKYNSLGALQWQTQLNNSGSGTQISYAIAADGSGNLYAAGSVTLSSDDNVLITKLDGSTGSFTWQRTLNTASSTDYANSIAVDSSSNVYIVGVTTVAFQAPLIAKYNSSGTIQWQRTLDSSVSDYGNGVAVDSSGNVYATGYTSGPALFLAKYNTSGTIQWQRTLTPDTNGQKVAVDSSGNVYVCGFTYIASPPFSNGYLIVKYDTSGTIQWQRQLWGGTASEQATGIAVDSSGNVYVTGTSTTGALSSIQLVKYDTSGTLQWQRNLSCTANIYGRGIAVDSSSNIYITGGTVSTGPGKVLFAKLPGDGSRTGSYTVGSLTFTYAVSTYTSSTTTRTSSASTLTDAASSMTDAAGTLTSSTPTLTSTVKTIY